MGNCPGGVRNLRFMMIFVVREERSWEEVSIGEGLHGEWDSFDHALSDLQLECCASCCSFFFIWFRESFWLSSIGYAFFSNMAIN